MPIHDVTPVGSGSGGGGESGAGSSDCNQLARELQNLQASLAVFQNKLDHTAGPNLPGSEKDNVTRTIAMLTAEIAANEARQQTIRLLPNTFPATRIQQS